MRIFKILFLFLFLSFTTFSFSITRESFSCKYDSYLDLKFPEDPYSYILLTIRAECLFKRNQDTMALHYLNQAIKNGGVYSAYLKAYHTETDGTFKPVNDIIRKSQIVDEAIAAYKDVLSVINKIPNYPPENDMNYVDYEKLFLMKIDSSYIITKLYMSRWLYQLLDHNSKMIKGSPSFNQTPETTKESLDLFFFPDILHFKGPIYSLNKIEKSAEKCASTPYIKYWDKNLYDNYIEACLVFKNFMEEVKPLELERMALIKDCKDFIIAESKSCKRYIAVIEAILEKKISTEKKVKKIMTSSVK